MTPPNETPEDQTKEKVIPWKDQALVLHMALRKTQAECEKLSNLETKWRLKAIDLGADLSSQAKLLEEAEKALMICEAGLSSWDEFNPACNIARDTLAKLEEMRKG